MRRNLGRGVDDVPNLVTKTIELVGGPQDGLIRRTNDRLPAFIYVGHGAGQDFFQLKYAQTIYEAHGVRQYRYAGRVKAKGENHA